MKIIKYIPNTITSMNLLSGVLGVIAVFGGRTDIAFYLMGTAAVFDFCDGMSARILKAYSELGKQLDSLSDLVSFGLLPSLMLYKVMTEMVGDCFWSYLPLMISVFSAFRLAKFNIDDRQSENFVGLAVPACAMVCGAFAYYVTYVPGGVLYRWALNEWMIPSASLVLSLLLVSEIPMFSMKLKRTQNKVSVVHRMRVAFIGVSCACMLVTLLLGLNWSFSVILIVCSYILMNLVNFLLMKNARQ